MLYATMLKCTRKMLQIIIDYLFNYIEYIILFSDDQTIIVGIIKTLAGRKSSSKRVLLNRFEFEQSSVECRRRRRGVRTYSGRSGSTGELIIYIYTIINIVTNELIITSQKNPNNIIIKCLIIMQIKLQCCSQNSPSILLGRQPI